MLALITTQFLGFLISRLVELQVLPLGLTTLLVLLMAAFGLALIPTLRFAEWLMAARGYVVQTAQSATTTAR